VSGEWKIIKRNAAGTLTTLATSAPGTFTSTGTGLHQFDVHIVYSTSGSIKFYLDGSNTPVMSYTGDTTTDGATHLNQFFLGTYFTGSAAVWSELIVSNADTRSMGLLTLPPVADGNTQDWIGAASDINETAL